MVRSTSDVQKLAATLEGVPVLALAPDGSAARAGLRRGDIILQTNGVRTKDVDAYFDATQLREGSMDVVVWRDGTEIEFEIERSL